MGKQRSVWKWMELSREEMMLTLPRKQDLVWKGRDMRDITKMESGLNDVPLHV